MGQDVKQRLLDPRRGRPDCQSFGHFELAATRRSADHFHDFY